MKHEDLRHLFGRRIRSLRRLRDITQERLAGALGCSTEYVSRMERGLSSPSFTLVERIAEALAVEVKDLFDFTELASPPPHRAASANHDGSED